MKRWYYLFVLCVLTSCLSPITIDDEDDGGVQRSVNVLTRSTSSIQYPLTLDVFDAEDESLVTSQIQLAEDEELSLHLPVGFYHMVALAGADECCLPSNPSLSDVITSPLNGPFSRPLQMGSALMNITQNTTMSIALHNMVSAISVSLSGISADATSVFIHLSPMASGILFGGDYVGTTTVRVPLEKEGDKWSAPLFYTLPTSGSLCLTVTTATPAKTYSHGYTLSHSLRPNTPYVISGSLDGGVLTNGFMPSDGWNEVENISFIFGDNNSNGDTIGVDNDVFEVEELPEVGTLWNGYFVVSHADSDDEIDRMLLLSTTEWRGITSAAHEETPSMAADIASTYTEGELDDWRIPTRNEVRKMCAASGYENLGATNEYLTTHGIAPLSTGEDADTGDAIRYLCDDAAYSFRWDSDGRSSVAGRKRTYHLRLVRTVGFSVK